ncbi:exosortase K [Clostridiaceae bacterium 35-E11]
MMNKWLFMIMIKPVAYAVELFLGVSFTYHEGIGFVNEALAINIGKECSGLQFFILVFFMLILSFIFKLKGKKKKLLVVFIFLIYAYTIAILVNAARIIASVFLMDLGVFLNAKQKILLHQSIGVVFYFMYLVASYFLFHKVIHKREEIQ